MTLQSQIEGKVLVTDLHSDAAFDPAKLVSQGFKGVYFKAGQGVLPDVPRVHPEWVELCKYYGLQWGWYWVVDSRYHSADQVLAMQKTGLLNNDSPLGWMLDVEKAVMSWTEKMYWATPYAGAKNIIDVAYLLESEGIKQGVYTGPGAFELIFRDSNKTQRDYIAKFPLWTAQYNPYIEKPDLYGSWTTWRFWQVSDTNGDVNVFNGTQDEYYSIYPPIGELPMQPVEPESLYIGTVLTTLKIRQNPTTGATGTQVGTLLKGQEVGADYIDMYGWWQLKWILIDGVQVPLPPSPTTGKCWSYQGENNGYIRLDAVRPPTSEITLPESVTLNYPNGVSVTMPWSE